jgi:hypothetical protein
MDVRLNAAKQNIKRNWIEFIHNKHIITELVGTNQYLSVVGRRLSSTCVQHVYQIIPSTSS